MKVVVVGICNEINFAKVWITPTNTNFSKPQFCCDIPFLRGRRSLQMPLQFNRNSLKVHFGYLDDIQTQKGESESMDAPFLFSQIRIFRALGLTLDSKVRYGCIYPFGICNNQFNFKSLDYLNISQLEAHPISPRHHII